MIEASLQGKLIEETVADSVAMKPGKSRTVEDTK